MRYDNRFATPIYKHWQHWYLEEHIKTFMCISAETDDNNRCYLKGGELIVPYNRGPGCVLIYCDNLWDPCFLNMQINFDSKVWIQPKNMTIQPGTRSITVNGAGWDPICIKNKAECFDGRGISIACECHTAEVGSMRIDFEYPLMEG